MAFRGACGTLAFTQPPFHVHEACFDVDARLGYLAHAYLFQRYP
jgi:hypothetical protein